MRCYHCSHEIKDSSFAYKGRQECKECHSVYQIHFPSGVGFIPIIIAFIPALYMVTSLRYSFVVGLAMLLNRKLNTSKNKIKLQNKIINRWNIMPL